MRALALAVSVALVGAPAAAAGEHRISGRNESVLQAGGGFVSWLTPYDQVFWRDGHKTRSAAPPVGPLGTDAAGRAVGLLFECGSARCEVLERRLPTGAIARRLTAAPNMSSADEQRGSFLVGFRGKGHPNGIYLRRHRDRKLRRLSGMAPGVLSISTHAMVAWHPDEDIYAASRDRPHHWRLVTTTADPDTLRGEYGGNLVEAVCADGRYVYWLEDDVDNTAGTSTTRVLRADPASPDLDVRSFDPPRKLTSLAVTRGNLFYVDEDTGSVYEYRRPAFR